LLHLPAAESGVVVWDIPHRAIGVVFDDALERVMGLLVFAVPDVQQKKDKPHPQSYWPCPVV